MSDRYVRNKTIIGLKYHTIKNIYTPFMVRNKTIIGLKSTPEEVDVCFDEFELEIRL